MQKKSCLAEIQFFENLLSDQKNSLVEQAINDGRIPIGYTCYVTPEPLMMVGKAFPVRMRAPNIKDTPQANYYMSLVTCSASRAILESMIDGKYDFLRSVLSGGACTHVNRCGQHFEVLDNFKDRISNNEFIFHVLDTPRKNSPATLELFIRDLKDVAGKLSDTLGLEFSDSALKKAIKDLNHYKSLISKVSDFRKGDNPKITGTEFHKVIVACHTAPKDMIIEPLKNLLKKLENREPITDYRTRVMITGTIFDNPEFTELIEKQGALVVADRYCFGSLPGLEQIPEDGDPWEILAKHYLDTCQCARMMDNSKKRYEQRKNYMKEFGAKGIIMQTIKFCDLWSYEGPLNLSWFSKENIPYIKIEHDYMLSNEGQIKTRIQAFVESIETL